MKSFPTQALLSLGASPNYKDRCGLTPLYHTVLAGGDTTCCETLLYYRSKIGTRDENGWDESHQVPADSSAQSRSKRTVCGSQSFSHPAPSSPSLCLFHVNWSNASTLPHHHPLSPPCHRHAPLSRHSPHPGPPSPPCLPHMSPHSPHPLLSLHSKGTKRSLEWKKCIRYPSSSHPVVIALLFHSRRLRKKSPCKECESSQSDHRVSFIAVSPQRELIPFLLQTRTHCPHRFYVTFWTISICAGIWLSWHFYFSPARLCVPPYFVQNSCDISVHAELNGDGWLVIYLSSLSLVVRLSFLFFPTQSFIICPPQSAEFYLAGTALHASHPLPFKLVSDCL